MGERMENTLIGEFIIILFAFFLVAYTKGVLDFSTTLLGKLVSLGVILYYTSIHKVYGVLAAAVLVFLQHWANGRNIDYIYGNYVREKNAWIGDTMHVIRRNEIMEGFNQDLLAAHSLRLSPQESSADSLRLSPFKRDFMEKYCEQGKLKYKMATVNPEMAEHVFPEIKYKDPNHKCHMCDPVCEVGAT